MDMKKVIMTAVNSLMIPTGMPISPQMEAKQRPVHWIS